MKTYTFTIVIEKEPEDPGYYAHCPALPGCFGAGDTVEATLDDMKLAMAQHLDAMVARGERIPVNVARPTLAEVTLEVPA